MNTLSINFVAATLFNLAFASFAFSSQVYFKNPTIDSVESFEEELSKSSPNTAVILGAGPAGLMSAFALKNMGYQHIFIIEKRETFSRYNTVTLRSEVFSMFKNLGIFEPIVKAGIFAPDSRVHRIQEKMVLKSNHNDLNALANMEINYSLPLGQIFKTLKFHFLELN